VGRGEYHCAAFGIGGDLGGFFGNPARMELLLRPAKGVFVYIAAPEQLQLRMPHYIRQMHPLRHHAAAYYRNPQLLHVVSSPQSIPLDFTSIPRAAQWVVGSR
jgi:hypothetical protein